jgi:carbonic anhydrase
MGVTETLTGRNAGFAEHGFVSGLRMMPSLKAIVIGCVDPRVDPTDVLGTTPGEVAAIRNVGGRITPATVEELVMLRAVTQAAGGDLGPGWELVVLHHTDCGITRLQDRPEMLTGYFGVAADGLSAWEVGDPWAAVAHDVDVLRAEPRLAGVRVSGLVYDVATGVVESVVAP